MNGNGAVASPTARLRRHAWRLLGALALALGIWSATSLLSPPEQTAVHAGPSKATTADAAADAGILAYRKGDYDAAIRQLQKPAEAGNYLAQYYLARIYGGLSKAHQNTLKSFQWFLRLVREHHSADSDDMRRSAVVARSLIALANYLREGEPDAAIPRSPDLVIRYLSHAAYALRNPDAEYELAKEYIGRGSRTGIIGAQDSQIRHALHSLYTLARTQWHAPSMLLLAELHALGRFVERSSEKALALARMAIRHATLEERIWMEETYQRIYCETGEDTRRRSNSIVDDWYRRYPEPAQPRRDSDIDAGLPALMSQRIARYCANGESVPMHDSWLRHGKRAEMLAREGQPLAGRDPLPTLPKTPASPPRSGFVEAGTTVLTNPAVSPPKLGAR